jgi:hydroxymethylglutaryl-CoA lyase
MKIIECPRDAMQGITEFIPTAKKIEYINQLLKVGFDTIDFGSFVSHKAVPQMRDTLEVLEGLDLSVSHSKLLAIVANLRGAEQGISCAPIHYLGFPLSISETFQQRNTHSSIANALNVVNDIQRLCHQSGKQLVCYISMGFGNPYGDPYGLDVVLKFVDILVTMDVEIISLSDTVGMAEPAQILEMFSNVVERFPSTAFGAHLHSNPATALEKIEAAHESGCQRFDSALKGFGGCPMAKDDLVGNLATETLLSYLRQVDDAPQGLDEKEFAKALALAQEVFPN